MWLTFEAQNPGLNTIYARSAGGFSVKVGKNPQFWKTGKKIATIGQICFTKNPFVSKLILLLDIFWPNFVQN